MAQEKRLKKAISWQTGQKRPITLELSFGDRVPTPTAENPLHLMQTADSEHSLTFDNRSGLAHDLGFLAAMPELCDVTFLAGEERQPVCGVRAVLAARSRVFRRLLFDDVNNTAKKTKKKLMYKQQSDSYIEKYDFKGQPTVVVPDFEPEVFKQLMEYCHTGSVMLQSRTLLGLMNAADHYALDELKAACIQFLERAINTDTVCTLLSSAEKYIQYKSTKILVQKMLEFVEEHGEVVLTLASFSYLPQHIVRIILGRDDLQASETTKFEAAFRWCLQYLSENPDKELKTAFEPFVSKIKFYRIPAGHLMKNVKPAEVVDDTVILTALAYQADPQSVDISKLTVTSKGPSSPRNEGVIQSFDASPPQFRRVKSSGMPFKSSMSQGNIQVEMIDSSMRIERSGSVPPADHRLDPHPTRVFEIRTDSRTSELSLSSVDSMASFSSGPRSPTMGRSTSSSSQFSTEGELPRKQSATNSESFVALGNASIEV